VRAQGRNGIRKASPATLALGMALALAVAACSPPAGTPQALQSRQEDRRTFPSQKTPARKKAEPAPASSDAPERPADRKRRYLEISHRQMRKFTQAIRPDEERLGSAALSAAALAAAGQPTREEAARWVSAALDLCAQRRDCGTAYMALQRIALQYQETLSQELLGRLLLEASRAQQAPGEQAVREPWSFKETENQRIVRMARNLVAFRLDPPKPGTPRAAAEQGWTVAAEAFLLAHDREGWYEAESPGYIAASMTALLHLADHAGSPRIRELAARQLDLLFAEWAQEQINGFPAGPKSRTYVHWALGTRNTPWLAWAWLAEGIEDPAGISFMDWPEIATSSYEMPAPVRRLLAERDRQPPYEIRVRRSIAMDKRLDLDTALYSFATPDYILGAAQSVRGVRLGVSGGQEIMATLYASCAPFAPLYLWSRTENPRSDRWKSWAGNDQALAHRNVALARLGAGGEAATGHAWLASAWSAPEPLGAQGGESGDVVVTRCGDTYAALITAGGWEVKPAPERFPAYYGGDKNMRGSWVAVPRRQPAAIALEVGRHTEHGSFTAWKKQVANAHLTLGPFTQDKSELRLTASDGTRLAFLPGERATVGGRALAMDYPLLAGPFLASEGPGRWTFSFGGVRQRFEALKSAPAP
jgi:hypothetical protein